MSDLLSLWVLAGEISEEKRIAAASCWHFCYPTGLTCFPPGAVHEAAFLWAAPFCPLMLPLFPLLKALVFGGQTCGDAAEPSGERGRTTKCVGCFPLRSPALFWLPKSMGRKTELPLPGRHWMSCIPLWNLHVRQPSRPRFLNAFHPLHRVVLLLVVCSVRNRSSNLLSTYCVPGTKFFMWMISPDFQNWYE